MLSGVVEETGGGVYRVLLDDGRRVDASLRGRLKREQRTGERVVVGDRVEVAEDAAGGATIEEVRPREREVVRRRPGGRKAKVVAANVDRLVVVTAARDPDPSLHRIDRLLVIAEGNDLAAALVVNKVDLDGGEVAERFRTLYGGAPGYPVVAASARTGEGIGAVEDLLCQGTSALVGASGVGKSSLLNAVEPGLRLRTGGVSGRIRRGRHTTVTARLLGLGCGGRVVDTPGFGDVAVWGVPSRHLDGCFPEMHPHRARCRFPDCAHLAEPDCGVRAAVEAGAVAESRYRSYLALLEEAREAETP